jgi:hypothetical protein
MGQTAAKRLSRAVRTIAQWCRANRHRPVCEQHSKSSQKMLGHHAYYGITGNMRMLNGFRVHQKEYPVTRLSAR